MFKHLLVPTDGSLLSQEAVRRAVSFAKEAGAHITALHVTPVDSIPYYAEGLQVDESVWRRTADLSEKASQEILDFVDNLCREAGVSCTKRSRSSDSPHDAIIRTATEIGCDLIFMASHGRKGVVGLLLGSETNKVLAHSKIPVLVHR